MIAGNATVRMDVVPFATVHYLGHLAGLNRVGLRRSQMPREDVQEVRLAYRTLFTPGRRWEEAVAGVVETARTPAGRELVAFLQGESKRGYVGGSRRRARADAPE